MCTYDQKRRESVNPPFPKGIFHVVIIFLGVLRLEPHSLASGCVIFPGVAGMALPQQPPKATSSATPPPLCHADFQTDAECGDWSPWWQPGANL